MTFCPADDREAAGQSAAEHLQLSVPSRDMSGRSCLQTLAAGRVRHASLEARVAEARNKRTSRKLFGELAAFNQVTRGHGATRDSCALSPRTTIAFPHVNAFSTTRRVMSIRGE